MTDKERLLFDLNGYLMLETYLPAMMSPPPTSESIATPI
jgi:hypothetical protein